MVDPASSVDEAREDLLARCAEQFECHGAEGIEPLLRQHPAEAAWLRQRLDELCAVGLLRHVPWSTEALPRVLGDYELGPVLGGGGMGVVHRARQRSLGREVAVKVIRPDRLHVPSARERFRRELEALARLRHPGIVPVFGGGEADGIPYFAMELVEGCSLESVLQALAGRRPAQLRGLDLAAQLESQCGLPCQKEARVFAGAWVEAAFEIARQVAHALAHAHQLGIVHRDVKPSNIMVLPDGRVLLFDFGLVWEAGSERVTRDGGTVGSPAYMAPEQLRGEELDARTDVYALGVTLYELLTLQHPFQATTSGELQQRVLAGERAPLRQRNHAVAWDAETVCLMAMDQDRGRRYQTAAALALDLTAVLQHQPIRGRRPGPLLRLRRWAQRRPALATALPLGTLLLVGVPTFLWRSQVHAAERIAEQRDLARANQRLALQAVNRFLRRMGSEDLQYLPHMQQKGQALLEDALGFYEQMLQRGDVDPALRLDHATALRDLAWVRMQLGRPEAALRASTQATGMLAMLAAGPQSSGEALELQANAWCDQGVVQRSLGNWVEAEAAFRRAAEQFAALAAGSARPHSARMGLANAHHRLASLLRQLGRAAEAQQSYQLAFDQLQALHEQLPAEQELTLSLAQVRHSLALVMLGGSQRQAATEHAEAARALLEQLRQLPDHSGSVDLQYSNTLVLLAELYDSRGEAAKARQLCADAVAACEQSLVAFPGILGLRQGMAHALTSQGMCLWQAGDHAAAFAAYERADALLVPLPDMDQVDEVPSYDHMRLLRTMAAARRDVGDTGAALQLLRRAAEAAAKASRLHRQVVNYRLEHARCLNELGILLAREGQLQDAAQVHLQALGLKQTLVAEHSERASYRQSLAATWHNLARVRQQLGDLEGAGSACEQAICEKRAVLQVDDGVADSHHSLAISLHNLAGLRLDGKLPAAALPLLQEACAHERRAVQINASNRGYRRQLVNSCEALAQVQLRLQQRAAVLELGDEMVATEARDAEVPVRAAVLACQLSTLVGDDPALQQRCLDRGLELLRQAVARGLRDRDRLLGEDALAPVRQLPGFAAVLAAMQ